MSTKLDTTFDTEHEEGGGFDPIPAGKYNADLMRATAGALQSGKGQAVTFSWCVWDGDYEGRWLFDLVIIQHESADAQKIGRRKFKDIAVACGITSPIDDVSVLVGKRCSLRVVIEQDPTGKYADKNRVTRVLPFVTVGAPQTARPQVNSQASPRANSAAANGKGGATAKADAVRDASTTPSSGSPEDVPYNDDLPY